MKSLTDEMEIVNAYDLVGSYRGAAALCGTTVKSNVRRKLAVEHQRVNELLQSRLRSDAG